MNDTLSEEILEALGISRPVYEEVQLIVGHMPTVDELSTLLAMWQSNGRQTSLLRWLKGQFHAAERHDYLGQTHSDSHEPKVRECLDIAHALFPSSPARPSPEPCPLLPTGTELFMVGDISTDFLNSDYARRYLHLSPTPVSTGNRQDDRDYCLLILTTLLQNHSILSLQEIARGGLFSALLQLTQPHGFDILACREIRLDAFLFGEEQGRVLVAVEEKELDFFLTKLSEAGLHCCLLGRVTAGRILVDGMDFGPQSDFCPYL